MAGLKIGAEALVHVAGIGQLDGLDHAVRNTPVCGKLRHFNGLSLRRAAGNGGIRANTSVVARLYGNLIFCSVCQSGNDGTGTGQIAAGLFEVRRTGCAVEHLIEGGVLGIAPAYAQCAVRRLHPNIGRRAGCAGGLRRGGDNGGGFSAPVAIHGGHLEEILCQIFQSGDFRAVGVDRKGLAQTVLAGSVGYKVARDIVDGGPGQVHLFISGLCRESLDLILIILPIVRHNVLQEFNLGNGGEFRLRAVLSRDQGNLNRDLLDRDLLPQVDGHYALASSAANGVYAIRRADIKGIGLNAFLGLHHDRARLNGAVALRTADDNLAHLHRLSEGDGNFQVAAGSRRRQLDDTAAGEEAVNISCNSQVRRIHGNSFHFFNRRGVLDFHPGRYGVNHLVDIGEVCDVHQTVAVKIVPVQLLRPAQLPVHGLQVQLADSSVSVDVSQGEAAAAGTDSDMFGIFVQLNFRRICNIARSGHGQFVLLSAGRQSGEEYVIVADYLFSCQFYAAGVSRGHSRLNPQLIGGGRAAGHRYHRALRAAGYGYRKVSRVHVPPRLRQSELDGELDVPRRACGGRLLPTGGSGAGGPSRTEGQNHQQAQESR